MDGWMDGRTQRDKERSTRRPVSGPVAVAKHQRRRGGKARPVRGGDRLDPLIRVDLVRAQTGPDAVGENLGGGAGQRPQAGRTEAPEVPRQEGVATVRRRGPDAPAAPDPRPRPQPRSRPNLQRGEGVDVHARGGVAARSAHLLVGRPRARPVGVAGGVERAVEGGVERRQRDKVWMDTPLQAHFGAAESRGLARPPRDFGQRNGVGGVAVPVPSVSSARVFAESACGGEER